MRALYRHSISRPRLVLALAALPVALAVPGLFRLELQTGGRALVPRGARAVRTDRALRETFGIEDPIVVLVRSAHPAGVFNPGTLRLVAELSRAIEALEGVGPGRVSSLETEPSDRHRPGTLGDFLRLLEPLPATPEECARLREDVAALEVFTGTIVSADGTAAAILAGAPDGTAERARLHRALETLVASLGDLPEAIDVIGAPVAESLLGLHILEDLGVPASWVGTEPAGPPLAGPPPSSGGLGAALRAAGRAAGLVPLALAMMALVFLAAFRRPLAALLPLLEVGTCLVVIFGFMGWLGAPVYLTTTVMPVILTVVGVADEIHIFGRFVWTARERPGISGAEAALATLDEMAVPVVKTSLTTMIGFLSFVLSPLVPVRAFGLATAGGVLFCMLFSLTVVPAVLALVRTSWLVSGVAKEGTREGTREGARLRASVFGALARTAARRRRVVIAVVLILASVLPFGIARVEVQDSWIDGFSPESGFYQATERFNAQFFGTHILAACIDARATVLQGELAAGLVGDHEIRLPSSIVEDPRLLVGRFVSIRLLGGPERLAALGRHIPVWDSWIESARREGEGAAGSIVATTPRYTGSARFIFQLEPADRVAYEIRAQRFLTPPVIEAARDFARFLAGHGDKAVGGVLGPADYLATTNFIAKRRDPEARELRVDTQRLQWLWEQYGRIRGEKRLREAVDPGFDRALVTAYLKNANFADTARLIAAIRAYEAERLAPEGIAVTLAGDVAVSQALIEGIARSQVSCLLLSLLGILAVTSVLERSLRAGLYCVIPPALAVLATFAFMGFADIPLGVATSMFSSMTLGIGVDYAIHILARHRLERARGAEPGEAARGALAACGPAITTDAVAVALGFGILTTSQVPANARLGLLTMLGIVTALLVSVILLPALLARRPAAGNPPRSSPPPPPPAGGRCGAG